MTEIASGASNIDCHSLTGEAELFGVTSECFFEQPALLQREGGEL